MVVVEIIDKLVMLVGEVTVEDVLELVVNVRVLVVELEIVAADIVDTNDKVVVVVVVVRILVVVEPTIAVNGQLPS